MRNKETRELKLYALKKKLQLFYSQFLHQRRSFMILSILKDEITKEKKYDDGSFRRMEIWKKYVDENLGTKF